MNNDKIYAVRDESTGKLVSNLTNPRKKYWDRRANAEEAIRKKIKYYPNLKLVTFELVEAGKEGEWVKQEAEEWYGSDSCRTYTYYKCSICDGFSERETDYCPNCGAKMKGV